MAYFPNGTSSEQWRSENCDHCIHDGDDLDSPLCPIESVHLLYNYDQNAKPEVKAILDMLIPLDTDGFAGRCPMLVMKNKRDRDWMDQTDVVPCKAPLMLFPKDEPST